MDRFDWLEIDIGAAQENTPALPPRARPHDGPSFYRAARLMRQSGHFGAAVSFYEQAIGFDEHNYPAWIELIDTLVRSRRLHQADERSQMALDSYRQVRTLYAARALVLAHTVRFDEAYGYCQVALEAAEPSWYAQCIRAEIALRSDPDSRSEVAGWLDRAVDKSKSLWETYFLGGWMWLDAELSTLAASYFAEAAHQNPRAPLAWLCLGDCFYNLQLYDQALFYYQRVTELEPAHELALERQKMCAPRLFGLMKAFRRGAMRARWKKNFDALLEQRREPGSHEF